MSSAKRKSVCPSEAPLDDGLCHEETTPEERPTKKAKSQSQSGRALPSVSRCLPIVLGGSHWHKEGSFENIVVFGDSYSSWNESKTWVDYLQRQMQKQGRSFVRHNFAFPGATAKGDLSDQLSSFTKFVNKEMASVSKHKKPALDSDRTTYFIFLGINDCGTTDNDELEAIVEGIFDAVHQLYVKAKARNFVLIDVPPIDRSPQAIDAEIAEEIEERVNEWNGLLQQQATEFGSTNKDATVVLFSSYRVLMDVLEDPLEYDFTEDDVTTEGGGIWADDLHLTSEMYDILGERLLTLLK